MKCIKLRINSKSLKGWLKKRTFPFLNKCQLQLNEVCYKVSLTEISSKDFSAKRSLTL